MLKELKVSGANIDFTTQMNLLPETTCLDRPVFCDLFIGSAVLVLLYYILPFQ